MTKLLVTVDIVLFTIRDRHLHVLLIRRLAKPFENRFALPGALCRRRNRSTRARFESYARRPESRRFTSNSYTRSATRSAIRAVAWSLWLTMHSCRTPRPCTPEQMPP